MSARERPTAAAAERVPPVLLAAWLGLWILYWGDAFSFQTAAVGTIMLLIGAAYGPARGGSA